ncbi:MAG: hypothetical protein ABIH46_12130 [Chloroflexota bacterium]
MKKTSEVIKSTLLVFILTFLVGLLGGYLQLDRGSISKGPILAFPTQEYMPIDVSNFGRETIDGLVFSVPGSTDISEIVASGPLQVDEIESSIHTSGTKSLRISGFTPNSVTRIMIPTGHSGKGALPEVVNARAMGLATLQVRDIRGPWVKMLEEALLMAGLYAVLIFFASVYLFRRMAGLEDELASAMADSKKMKQHLRELSSQIEGNFGRLKVLLLARLNDYSKELSFWRDTIRAILYSFTGDDKSSETVIDQVTKTLKTYGTKEFSHEDFEVIKVLANMMTRERKSESAPD